MELLKQYKLYNTQYPDQEIIGGCLFDTVQYVSGATLALNLFNALRATPDLSNMEIPSQLPAPKAFLVRGVRFGINTGVRTTARAASGNVTASGIDDVAQLINTGVLRLTIGNKIYAEFPLWALPEGCGPSGVIAIDTALLATPGVSVSLGVNGMPDNRNVFTLSQPLFIAPQINFIVVLTWPAAITLTGGNTMVRVYLDGDLIRPVQ